MSLQGLVVIVITRGGNCRLRFTLSKLQFPLYMLCVLSFHEQEQMTAIEKRTRAGKMKLLHNLMDTVNSICRQRYSMERLKE